MRQIILLALSTAILSNCSINWGCEEKAISKSEESAVQEIISLNKLDSIRPSRIASQSDVEGCPTGHVTNIFAEKMNLDTIPPSIANFTRIESIHLEDNNLKNLPIEIIYLHPFLVAIRGNKICNPSDEIRDWLSKWDSAWISSQKCP